MDPYNQTVNSASPMPQTTAGGALPPIPGATQPAMPVAEQVGPAPQQPMQAGLPQPNVQPPMNQEVQVGAASVPVGGSSPAAEDVDLIEKEWVVKAKSIVSQTRNDPSQQSVNMNRIEADYLKKRYNKDIKVSGS